MSDRNFLDTNIFVYAVTVDGGEQSSIAEQLVERSLESHDAVISYQVVQEFLSVVLTKFKVPLPVDQVRRYVATVFREMHMVHSSLQDAGWSTQLLCSVFGFAPDAVAGADIPGTDAVTQPIFLVYLAKQGTFYPFAPTGSEQRDNELELRLKGMLAEDLPIEPDLSRWFPMWDLPIA